MRQPHDRAHFIVPSRKSVGRAIEQLDDDLRVLLHIVRCIDGPTGTCADPIPDAVAV